MTRTVYDIKIAEGSDAGFCRMTGIGEINPDGARNRAEKLKAEFEADFGARCEIIERTVDLVDPNDLF